MQTEYWRLVHDLMGLGWYRRGPTLANHADRICWRFRAGHVINRLPERTIQIPASDECTAMRLLLERIMVQRAVSSRQCSGSLAVRANGVRQ